jgi:hypothetical protein
MNGYERSLRTLRYEKTDCVPTWSGWIVSAEFFEYITGKHFWDDPLAIAIEAYQKLEVDMIMQCMYLPGSEEDFRRHTTETISGGEKYKTIDDVLAYINALPYPEMLEKDYDFEGNLVALEKEYIDLQEALGENIFCLPYSHTCSFIWFSEFGYENYLMTTALHPEAIRRLYEHSAEEERLHNSVLAELVKQKKIPPFFFTAQDICGGKGPMVAPEVLRDLYFPNVAYSLKPLVDVGAEIIWHCDGYIIPIIDDIIASGVTGFQGFQEWTGFDIKDIAQKKVRTGRKPLLLAGLSVDRVLPFGTVKDVEQDIERIINSVGTGGGLAIGHANTPGPDCKNENLETLYRYTHKYSGVK